MAAVMAARKAAQMANQKSDIANSRCFRGGGVEGGGYRFGGECLSGVSWGVCGG